MLRWPFPESHVLGAVVAMTSNFLLNNFLTYRDQRLKRLRDPAGLLLFYLVCSVGLLANVGVAFSVYDQVRSGGWRGRGRVDGRGLELRDVQSLRLAQAISRRCVASETRSFAIVVLTVAALVLLRLVSAA